MKATEHYFPVVLFIMLYKVVLTIESLGETLNSIHSNEATEQYFPLVMFSKLCKVGVHDSYSLRFDFNYFDLIM